VSITRAPAAMTFYNRDEITPSVCRIDSWTVYLYLEGKQQSGEE